MKFPLGRIVITRTALAHMEQTGDDPRSYLLRHMSGDWGDLGGADKRSNEQAVARGLRLLSRYKTPGGEALYVITEHDRSATTIMLTSDY